MERRSAILAHGDGFTAFQLDDDQDLDELVVYLVGQLPHTGGPPVGADTLQLLIRHRGTAFCAPVRLEDAEYSRRNLSYTVCADVSDRLRANTPSPTAVA
jgi:hypothetical protein